MLPRPDQKTIKTIMNAARKMTRIDRRRFQAQAVMDHCNGNTSLARVIFGWDQRTTQKAILEMKNGKFIADQPRNGRNSFSKKLPNLETDNERNSYEQDSFFEEELLEDLALIGW